MTDRQIIAGWLAFVQATHRDRFTVEHLTKCLVTGCWSWRMVQFGRELLDRLAERC
jgi:hypothetical protein